MLTKSNGMASPLTTLSAAMLADPVPCKFQLMPLPLPPGNWVTATLRSASCGCDCCASPLNTSCGIPSPEQQAITSHSSTLSSRAICSACLACVVCCTSTMQCAALKIGAIVLVYIFTADPLPLKGLIMTFIRLFLRDLP